MLAHHTSKLIRTLHVHEFETYPLFEEHTILNEIYYPNLRHNFMNLS